MVGLTQRTRAIANITMEVPINDNWSGDATVEQIVEQATRSAKQKVSEILRGHGRIIGEIKITMIMAEGSNG